jgi:hypothetical protein
VPRDFQIHSESDGEERRDLLIGQSRAHLSAKDRENVRGPRGASFTIGLRQFGPDGRDHQLRVKIWFLHFVVFLSYVPYEDRV